MIDYGAQVLTRKDLEFVLDDLPEVNYGEAVDIHYKDDNPFPGSPVYSYGHRVVQGMTWDPESKMMFDSEHGPSGAAKELYVQHSDEINIIEKGSSGF